MSYLLTLPTVLDDFFFDWAYGKPLRNTIAEGNSGYSRMKRQFNKKPSENGDFVFTMDVAGLEPDDIEVKAECRDGWICVTINGETEKDYGKYAIQEKFSLPARKYQDKATKKIENGILILTFAAKEPVQSEFEIVEG